MRALSTLPTCFAVALGGALGTLLRYRIGLAGLRAGSLPWTAFPWTTLAINVVGSFVLGFLARAFVAVPLPPTAVGAAGRVVVSGAAPALPAPVFLGLTVGLCGGFTTFSTFSVELLGLAERGAWARAWAYATASVALGVGAAFLGAALGRMARSAW